MTSTPREIGTLVIVVLKANHLPNKRHIGKQDPYCAVTIDGETRRTKAIKRGGQHPEWDEEIRFAIYEDEDDSSQGDLNGTPPPPPPKDPKPQKIKGGSSMKIACYADDVREPDLIGEGTVDLKEVLTKGESDEWWTLMHKDRFAGKVYLEMTFWSNAPAPPQNKKSGQIPSQSEYVGPGSFVAESISSSRSGQSNRVASTSILHEHPRRQSDSVSSSLRPSSSLAQLDLYQAPYEQGRMASLDSLTRNMGELGVMDHQRRESFPPPQNSYRPPSSISDATSTYSYNRSVTPTGLPNPHSSYSTQSSYNPDYESSLPTGYRPPSRVRTTRYSIPTSSSGFIPLASSGFPPPASHTPAPSVYAPSHFIAQAGYAPAPTQTPIPASYSTPSNTYDNGPPPQNYSPTPAPTGYSTPPAGSFDHGSTIAPSPDSYSYPHYAPTSAQQYLPQSTPQVPFPSQSAPPDSLTGYPPVSSASYDGILSSSTGPGGSRPLPPQPGPPPVQPAYPLPASASQQHSYSPHHNSMGMPTGNSYSSIPPPPSLLPPAQSHGSLSHTSLTHSPESQHTSTLTLPPPPPPPQINLHSTSRRASLPQPPVQIKSTFQYLPPPPPLPGTDFHPQGIPPPPPVSQIGQPFYPGPPPRPPTQLTHSEPQPFPPTSYGVRG